MNTTEMEIKEILSALKKGHKNLGEKGFEDLIRKLIKEDENIPNDEKENVANALIEVSRQ